MPIAAGSFFLSLLVLILEKTKVQRAAIMHLFLLVLLLIVIPGVIMHNLEQSEARILVGVLYILSTFFVSKGLQAKSPVITTIIMFFLMVAAGNVVSIFLIEIGVPLPCSTSIRCNQLFSL